MWFGGDPLLPVAFPVTWTAETLTLGPLTAEVVTVDAGSVFARMPGREGATLQVVRSGREGTWSYTGPAGQAAGVLALR